MKLNIEWTGALNLPRFKLPAFELKPPTIEPSELRTAISRAWSLAGKVQANALPLGPSSVTADAMEAARNRYRAAIANMPEPAQSGDTAVLLRELNTDSIAEAERLYR